MPVLNMKNYKIQEGDIYIAGGSKDFPNYWAGPIKVGEECTECEKIHIKKEDTLKCFESWAREKMEEDLDFRERLRALHGRNLVCNCSPAPCHGEILLKLSAEINIL